MINRLKAYKGEDFYTFISYAHKDFEQVHEILCKLNQMGFNLWYDEGIDPGNEWADEIADALYKSRLFIVFVSKNAMNSKNVINECFYALDNGIPFLAVFLEDAEYTKGLSLRASSTQAIMKYRMSDNDFYNKASTAMRMMLEDSYKVKEYTSGHAIERKKPNNLLVKKLSLPLIILIVLGLFSAIAYSVMLLTDLTSELYSLKNHSEKEESIEESDNNIVETEETLAEVSIEDEITSESSLTATTESKFLVITTTQPNLLNRPTGESTPTTSSAKYTHIVDVGYGISETMRENGDFEVTVTREYLPLYVQYATKLRVHGNSLKQSVTDVFTGLNNPTSVSQMSGESYPLNESVITYSSNESYYDDHFITLASDEEILLMIHVKGGQYFDVVENDILSRKAEVVATEAIVPDKKTFSGISVSDLKDVINLSYGISNVLNRSNFGFVTNVVRDKLPSYAQEATNLAVWGNTDGYNLQTAFDLLVDGGYWKRNFNPNFLPPLTKGYTGSDASYYDNHFVILSNEEKVLMVIHIKDQEQVGIIENK